MSYHVVGTAGHVDHGKTTLVRALTGIDTDRLEEEKRRGLTIDIGFAHLDLGPDNRLGIVDVPGHHDFLTNMLAGSTGIEAVLLVVAAHEGPMPQTLEHLDIAALLGVQQGIIALTHVDRVDAEFAQLAASAAADEVRGRIGRDWTVVPVEAISGRGLGDLRAELGRLAESLPPVVEDPVFRLPVDRAFTVPGAGTVVTGTVWSGSLRVGERVLVQPGGRQARIRSLQVHGEDRQSVRGRRRCAAGVAGLNRHDVRRGDSVVKHPTWRPVRRFGARLELLDGETRPLHHGQRVRLFLGTAETMARVELAGGEPVPPGASAWMVLDCESDVLARAGDRFLVRFYSPVELLGGGRVAELDPPRRWRDRVDDWADCLSSRPATSIEAALRLCAAQGTSAEELRLKTPHPLPGRFPPEWKAVQIGDRWFDPEQVERRRCALVAWLERAHRDAPRESGVALEAMRAAAGRRAAPELVEAAFAALVEEGILVSVGPRVRLAEHAVELNETEVEARRGLVEAIRVGGFMPPPPSDLAVELGVGRGLVNDLLRLLAEDGSLVRLTPDLWLTAEQERELRRRALQVLEAVDRPTPSEFRRSLDVTRRYLIPMLEYLDRIGWTERAGDGRIAGPLARIAEPAEG